MSGPESVHTGPSLGGNLVRAFPVGGEFVMFLCACYGFQVTKNKITGPNRLQPYYTIMEACDAKLV